MYWNEKNILTCKETFPEFNTVNIKHENEVKLLGITLDEKLRIARNVNVFFKKAVT